MVTFTVVGSIASRVGLGQDTWPTARSIHEMLNTFEFVLKILLWQYDQFYDLHNRTGEPA